MATRRPASWGLLPRWLLVSILWIGVSALIPGNLAVGQDPEDDAEEQADEDTRSDAEKALDAALVRYRTVVGNSVL